MASDQNKPNGQFVITPEMGPGFVESLAVGKFHGIGPATARKMNVLSIFTGLDLKPQTLGLLQERIVKAGAHYYWISRAVDNRSVQLDRIRKSIGAENTFEKDLESFEEMKVVLEPIIDKVWRHCELTRVRSDGDAQSQVFRLSADHPQSHLARLR
jgi:DNA polymerase-4